MNTTDTDFKPTPGPWKYAATWANSCQEVYSDEGKQLAVLLPMSECGIEGQSNAALIAEAGTVYSETGKTPRQLAEDVARLRAALQQAKDMLWMARVEVYNHNRPNYPRLEQALDTTISAIAATEARHA